MTSADSVLPVDFGWLDSQKRHGLHELVASAKAETQAI